MQATNAYRSFIFIHPLCSIKQRKNGTEAATDSGCKAFEYKKENTKTIQSLSEWQKRKFLIQFIS